MSSLNAENVAKDVIEATKNSDRINLGEIVEKRGYSPSTVKHPKRVTRTQSYQKAMKPFSEMIDDEISKIQAEMSSRDISKERYESLARVMDTLYKNRQLATGGATERVINIQVAETIAKKNDIDISPKQDSGESSEVSSG